MEAAKPDAGIHSAVDSGAMAQNPKVHHFIDETILTRARAALAARQNETALRLLNSLDALNLELPGSSGHLINFGCVNKLV